MKILNTEFEVIPRSLVLGFNSVTKNCARVKILLNCQQKWSTLFSFVQFLFCSIVGYLGVLSSPVFSFALFRVFVSSTIHTTNLHCYSRNRNRGFVLLCFQYFYCFLSLKIAIRVRCEASSLWFVDFSSERTTRKQAER